jgi:hypothetical protein
VFAEGRHLSGRAPGENGNAMIAQGRFASHMIEKVFALRSLRRCSRSDAGLMRRSAFLLEWEDDHDHARPAHFISQPGHKPKTAFLADPRTAPKHSTMSRAVISAIQRPAIREIARRLANPLGVVAKRRQKFRSLAANLPNATKNAYS